jgi:hypothetical protein
MMDQFYVNEPMHKVNKGLFTFVSYNTGPGRIAQLCGLAAKIQGNFSAHRTEGSMKAGFRCTSELMAHFGSARILHRNLTMPVHGDFTPLDVHMIRDNRFLLGRGDNRYSMVFADLLVLLRINVAFVRRNDVQA